MTDYPTPVKIAAKPLHDALRLQTVLTIETVEAALYEHVYKLWEARGMFGHDDTDDLDLACEILDLARHEIYDNRGNRARARTKEASLNPMRSSCPTIMASTPARTPSPATPRASTPTSAPTAWPSTSSATTTSSPPN